MLSLMLYTMAILHAAQSNLSKVNDPFSSQKLQESCDSAVVPTTKGKCSSMIWSIVHPYQIPVCFGVIQVLSISHSSVIFY